MLPFFLLCLVVVGWNQGTVQSPGDSSYYYYNYNQYPAGAPAYHYKLNSFYSPARVERYAIEHAVEWNFHRVYYPYDDDDRDRDDNHNHHDGAKARQRRRRRQKHTSPPRACLLWKPSSRKISDHLQEFQGEMNHYQRVLQSHMGSPAVDVREHLNSTSSSSSTTTTAAAATSTSTSSASRSICQSLQVHPQGLGGIFTSGSLSRSPQGLLEPLYPPFGSLTNICPELQKHHGMVKVGSTTNKKRMQQQQHELDFLVHDFAHQCQQLTRTSKIILVQIGYGVTDSWKEKKKNTGGGAAAASSSSSNGSPTISLLKLYRKFGMPVDEIYLMESKPETTTDSGNHNNSKKKQKKDGDDTDNNDWVSSSKGVLQVLHWDTSTPKVVSATKDEKTKSSSSSQQQQHPWKWIAANTQPDDLVLVTVQFPPRGQADPSKEFALLQALASSSSSATSSFKNTRQYIDHLYFHPVVYMAEEEIDPKLVDKKRRNEEKQSRKKKKDDDSGGEQQQRAEDNNVGGSSSSSSRDTSRWTVQEALYLFADLRKQGILAHAWVAEEQLQPEI